MTTSIRGYIPKREGSARIRSNKGTPVYECSYTWIVVATSKTEDYLDVLNTSGLPIVGVTVEPTGYAVCTSKNAVRRAENPLYWDVTCEFSSEIDDRSGSQGGPSGPGGGGGGETGNNPEAWVPIYETKFWQHQELVTIDANNDPVVNSAGQPFPTGITITRFLPMWEFFQIEPASTTDNQILARCEVVNSNTFKGRDPHTLLCTVLSSVIGRYYGSLRRLTQYQLKYKPDNWKLKRYDTGTQYNTAPPIEIIDAGKLVNLNGSGRLTDNDGRDPPSILEFDVYTPVSFSFLRI